MNVAAILDLLGGPSAIAEALACHRSRPYRWYASGIPARRYADLLRLAEAKGVALSAGDLLSHAVDGSVALNATQAKKVRARRGARALAHTDATPAVAAE